MGEVRCNTYSKVETQFWCEDEGNSDRARAKWREQSELNGRGGGEMILKQDWTNKMKQLMLTQWKVCSLIS